MTTDNFTAPDWIALDQLAVISVSGADRIAFLQGQLTNDVTRLHDGVAMRAGWCTPQGRLLSTPLLLSVGETIYMIVQADEIERLFKRLKLYVLRSKVQLNICSQWRVAGSISEAAAPDNTLAQAELPIGDVGILQTLHLPPTRRIALVPAESDLAQSSLWWAATIVAAEAWVLGPAIEQFVPQAINLELTAGVSFSKGCYTGQEVVSRIEHIGKPSRRAALFTIGSRVDLPPMSPVTSVEGEEIGCVILSAQTETSTVALVQLPAAIAKNDDIAHVRFAGTVARRLLLPYDYQRL